MKAAGPDIDHGSCPLCSSAAAAPYCRDERRSFFRCAVCGLVFVPPSQLLSGVDEKKRYDLHRNSTGDAGYRAFLERMVTALLPDLPGESSGLDFGCGPEPVLAGLFEEAGHRVDLYDHFYRPDEVVFGRQYVFITATEVVEHLRDPRSELDRLWRCLRPGGSLGIMTRPAAPAGVFGRWHYKNDLTHIRFFSPATFAWLAGQWRATLEFPQEDIAVLRRERVPA